MLWQLLMDVSQHGNLQAGHPLARDLELKYPQGSCVRAQARQRPSKGVPGNGRESGFHGGPGSGMREPGLARAPGVLF